MVWKVLVFSLCLYFSIPRPARNPFGEHRLPGDIGWPTCQNQENIWRSNQWCQTQVTLRNSTKDDDAKWKVLKARRYLFCFWTKQVSKISQWHCWRLQHSKFRSDSLYLLRCPVTSNRLRWFDWWVHLQIRVTPPTHLITAVAVLMPSSCQRTWNQKVDMGISSADMWILSHPRVFSHVSGFMNQFYLCIHVYSYKLLLAADKTTHLIGVPETFLISAISGVIWAFFSAQPIIVIGVTGPVLIFEESLFQVRVLNLQNLRIF